jgi:hypothetical protein
MYDDSQGQERLFRLAPEAVAVNGYYVHREGWTLVVAVRRGDEDWSRAHRERYDRLSTDELLQVLDSDLTAALGL